MCNGDLIKIKGRTILCAIRNAIERRSAQEFDAHALSQRDSAPKQVPVPKSNTRVK
jgi:hypothetical protein